MRSLFFMLQAFVVIALAYWAYDENYETKDALNRVDNLQRDIGRVRENLNVLKAEWAYLNRPERLRDLADLNYDSLQLIPLMGEHFGDVAQVAYPRLDLGDLSAPVDTIAETDPLAQVTDAPVIRPEGEVTE
jgi:hypothetical protein